MTITYLPVVLALIAAVLACAGIGLIAEHRWTFGAELLMLAALVAFLAVNPSSA